MKLVTIALLFITVSCKSNLEPFQYTESQKKYFNSLPLSKQVYLDSCLNGSSAAYWTYCQRVTEQLGCVPIQTRSSSDK